VNIVAWALDKVIKECLGDPLSPRVITHTVEKNVWNSTLKLSAALNSTPLPVMFDDRAHRVVPMALGNLVKGIWKVAGVYDPTRKTFTERSEIIQWPKTGKSAPRSWWSCQPGERLVSPAGELQHCEPCHERTFSLGQQSTVCIECAPGERADSDSMSSVALCVDTRYHGHMHTQVTSSPNQGSSLASSATASAMSTRSSPAKHHATAVLRTHKDTSASCQPRIVVPANARMVRAALRSR
jgi:hypothetical protein